MPVCVFSVFGKWEKISTYYPEKCFSSHSDTEFSRAINHSALQVVALEGGEICYSTNPKNTFYERKLIRNEKFF